MMAVYISKVKYIVCTRGNYYSCFLGKKSCYS